MRRHMSREILVFSCLCVQLVYGGMGIQRINFIGSKRLRGRA